MRPLQIGIEARLQAGTVGGVEQALVGLAHGLSQLADGEETYYFLVDAGRGGWITPYLRGPCRPLPVASASYRPGWMDLLLRSFPALRLAFHHLSPMLGRQSIRVPQAPPLPPGVDLALLHFATQSAFVTGLPNLFQPWDLQHVHLPEFFTPRERLARDILYRRFCAQARRVIVSSEWGRRDLIRHYGLPEEKVAVVPGAPAVGIDAIPPAPALAAIRRKFDLPNDFLFYPAHTWPHKNHLGLLSALAQLRDQSGLRVPLVCSGHQTSHFKKIQLHLRQLGLTDQVRFLGYVSPEELRGLYALCRGLAFPTQFEGLGLPLLEAFRAGVPAACSRVTCLPELAGGAALLFDPGQPDDIARALRELWMDAGLRRRLIDRGRARASQFSWERTARIFRAHYRQLAGQALNEEDRERLAAVPRAEAA